MSTLIFEYERKTTAISYYIFGFMSFSEYQEITTHPLKLRDNFPHEPRRQTLYPIPVLQSSSSSLAHGSTVVPRLMCGMLHFKKQCIKSIGTGFNYVKTGI